MSHRLTVAALALALLAPAASTAAVAVGRGRGVKHRWLPGPPGHAPPWPAP